VQSEGLDMNLFMVALNGRCRDGSHV
jgi:hypothetical protein